MYNDDDHIARVHVYGKCVEIDITWSEVEAMLDGGEVIEEHVFRDLMVKEIRLLVDWARPLHVVYIVHHAVNWSCTARSTSPRSTNGSPATGRGGSSDA